MTATSVVVAVLCALLITAFMALILLCVAMFMIACLFRRNQTCNLAIQSFNKITGIVNKFGYS